MKSGKKDEISSITEMMMRKEMNKRRCEAEIMM
jgi:hypothetical protein